MHSKATILPAVARLVFLRVDGNAETELAAEVSGSKLEVLGSLFLFGLFWKLLM